MNVFAGNFYEFMRDRNVARAGQPLHLVGGIEIGHAVPIEHAFAMVKNGRDVYTLQ